jgi:diacylglycerol diphosphate phosphatase / phosphatidate phosphatase
MCEAGNPDRNTQRLDCRETIEAIQSPVCLRSFEEIKKEVFHELKAPQILETLLFLLIGFVAKTIPKLLLNLWLSPIPYQETSTGDVILELDLNYPFNEQETVPNEALYAICVFLPILFLGVSGMLCGPTGDARSSLCALFIAMGFSELIIGLVKLYCGRFRPNFYNMCGFDSESKECQAEDSHRLYDSRKSFPSGHSGLSFSSMLVFSLYLAGKVGIQRQAPSIKAKLLYLLAWTPMSIAFFVATSRVHDFYHHPVDIVAGSVIGGACAMMAHGMW